jgi:hypothetical protein
MFSSTINPESGKPFLKPVRGGVPENSPGAELSGFKW